LRLHGRRRRAPAREQKEERSTLRDIVLSAVEMNRIRFADLRRLQRDILPFRLTTQEEAEMLLSLDATVERADRDWR
jgi:hypothetical protein